MKKITIEWLVSKNACHDGLDWFVEQGKEVEPIPLLYLLIKKKKLDWANWLVVRVMDYSQYVSYAVFAAELVIDIFEKEFPDDKRPRTAIEAAKKCIKNPSDENKKEAVNAARAAYWVADRAARAAGWAAESAADRSASSAGRAAKNAADSAPYRAKILKKILKYGIKLLTGGK